MELDRKNLRSALTLTEVLVIVAVLAVLAVILVPAGSRGRARALRTQCISQLIIIGQGEQQSLMGHTNVVPFYPTGVSTNYGGTQEYISNGEVFRHFQVLSNEIFTPKILVCPSDVRKPAKSFETLSNSNISYFIGLDASEILLATFLAGDRNLTNDTLSSNGILEVTSESTAGWTREIHWLQGDVLLSDGSVQSLSNIKLGEALAGTGVATNRLAMPLD